MRACACVRVHACARACVYLCVLLFIYFAHVSVCLRPRLRECVGCWPTEHMGLVSDNINDGRRCECVLTGPVLYNISAMRALGICVWPKGS